jgi:membrane protease subunit HflC
MITPTISENRQGAGDVRRRAVWLAGIVVAVVVVLTSVVFVDETEFVLVETLGRIVAVYDRVGNTDSDRGLHFKLPWPIATVRRFDRRQQLFDPPGREIFTSDKKNITVTSYLCWRIAEPAAADTPFSDRPVVKFFRGLGNVQTAEARLEARVRSALEVEFGRVELTNLLRVATPDGAPAEPSPLEEVAGKALARLKRQDDSESLTDRLGIELVDLRIRRINLPEGNRQAVYERMRTERERIAERYRSAGLAEKSRIESQGRLQSDEILARADADAERIRGDGEAEAIRILNEAHARDPEFYEFQRTLATYTKILSERTTLVISSGSRLFKLLTDGVPEPAAKDGPADRQPAGAPKTAGKSRGDGAAREAPLDGGGGAP